MQTMNIQLNVSMIVDCRHNHQQHHFRSPPDLTNNMWWTNRMHTRNIYKSAHTSHSTKRRTITKSNQNICVVYTANKYSRIIIVDYNDDHEKNVGKSQGKMVCANGVHTNTHNRFGWYLPNTTGGQLHSYNK